MLTFSNDKLEECFRLCEKYIQTLKPPILFLRTVAHRDRILGVVKYAKNEEEHEKLEQIKVLLGHDLQTHIVHVLCKEKSMFLMNRPHPFLEFPPISTLRDMFVPRVCRNVCTETIIKSIVFQVLSCLVRLHSHDLNFTHNDMKAENILLEKCDLPFLTYDTTRIFSNGVRIVFIDAESVTGKNFKCSLQNSMSASLQKDFGMELDAQWSEFTDFHLVCMEILFACKTSRPKWGLHFAEFLERDGIPLQYFKAPFITKENRLSCSGKTELGKERRSLQGMLNSKYFDSIRVNEESFSDIKIEDVLF